jgi:hypothetical protein
MATPTTNRITSDKGLRVALDQLAEVYTALAAVRAEHPEATREWLAALTEGFIDQARQLQREIEEYRRISGRASDPVLEEPHATGVIQD